MCSTIFIVECKNCCLFNLLFKKKLIFIYFFFSFPFGNQIPPDNVTPVSTAIYGITPTFSWAHTVPSLMPWVTQGDQDVPDPIMRFTAPFPPDPCTSQTATSWELLNNLGANKTNVNMHLKRKSDLDVLE